jgi:hypothetical protein
MITRSVYRTFGDVSFIEAEYSDCDLRVTRYLVKTGTSERCFVVISQEIGANGRFAEPQITIMLGGLITDDQRDCLAIVLQDCAAAYRAYAKDIGKSAISN